MKNNFLTKFVVLLTVTIYSLTYFFLIPLARTQITNAQDIGIPKAPQQKIVSKLYIPTGGSSTFLKTNDGEEALLIQDHLSSTRVIDSKVGSQSQQYYPFGQTNLNSNTITDKQFTSHRTITDTGVYHAGARFYNPQLGMFVSADKVQGPNRYMYAMGNPTKYNDPTGEIVPIIIAAIIIGGAAFGAGFGTGYEQQSQVNQYGSVQEPAKVVMSGVTGAAVGAGAGYLGAVAVPAAIGAIGTGAAASTSVGLVGGAQIGVGACLTNPACIDAVEMGAQLSTGSDLPPGLSFSGGRVVVDGDIPSIKFGDLNIGAALDEVFPGSGGVVRAVDFNGGQVAAKIDKSFFQDGATTDRYIDYITNEVDSARILGGLGIGPNVHASITHEGRTIGYLMDIVDGAQPQFVPHNINARSFDDLRHNINTLQGAGYDIGDFQYLVGADGRVTLIDAGAMRPLEHWGGALSTVEERVDVLRSYATSGN